MLEPTRPYRRELGDQLVLKSCADEADVERIAAFNGKIHDEGVAGMTRELLLRHPHTRPEHWLYVEDEATRRIASALCLIPWTWSYAGVDIQAGEMGIVGTLEDYRHRGLIRALVGRFKTLLRDGGFDLSQIQGIPYFYRQFGYEYAIPLEGGWHIELHQISEQTQRNFTFRLATEADIPTLVQFYDQAVGDLDIHSKRSMACWQYLMGPSTLTEMVAETWMVQDAAGGGSGGQVCGYFRVPTYGFGEGMIVNEVSRLSPAAADAALVHLKALCTARAKPYIRLCLPTDTMLVRAASARGGRDAGYYAWQIHLVAPGRLMRKLGPVFERRLAASPFAGLTRALVINLYRQAFELCFVDGQLTEVKPLGFRDGGDISLPPLLLAPLLLGYRGRQSLSENYPDVSVRGDCRDLVDVLFGSMSSFIYTIY